MSIESIDGDSCDAVDFAYFDAPLIEANEEVLDPKVEEEKARLSYGEGMARLKSEEDTLRATRPITFSNATSTLNAKEEAQLASILAMKPSEERDELLLDFCINALEFDGPKEGAYEVRLARLADIKQLGVHFNQKEMWYGLFAYLICGCEILTRPYQICEIVDEFLEAISGLPKGYQAYLLGSLLDWFRDSLIDIFMANHELASRFKKAVENIGQYIDKNF